MLFWFHGGFLQGYEDQIAEELASLGFKIITFETVQCASDFLEVSSHFKTNLPLQTDKSFFSSEDFIVISSSTLIEEVSEFV